MRRVTCIDVWHAAGSTELATLLHGAVGEQRVHSHSCLNVHFRHAHRNIDAIVHGDDFVSTADVDDLLWFKEVLESKFEITTAMIGHDKDDTQQIQVLNHVIEVHA